MAPSFQFCTIICILFVANYATFANGALSTQNFYAKSCPSALTKIKTSINAAILKERRMGASLLRLNFHDCFVNGCDASILLDDTRTFLGEKTAGPNFNSVRGYELIDSIKLQLESTCRGVVSCADIVIVATRDAIVALGGPSWNVQLGRRDSTTANFNAADNLPSPFSNLPDLVSAFAAKGFTTKDVVALSGAHTIGKARCQFYRDRIYNEVNINSAFASWLKANCPQVGGDDNLAPLDSSTNVFDNTYYKNLRAMRGLFHSDQELFGGKSTDNLIKLYSMNSTIFFADFVSAMIKLGSLSPLTGRAGQIRTSCRKINRK